MRIARRAMWSPMILVLITLSVLGQEPMPGAPAPNADQPMPPAAPAPPRVEPQPPACPGHRDSRTAPAHSARTRPGWRAAPAPLPGPGSLPIPPGMPAPMAQMFQRMSQSMARNPAQGFQVFVNDLARLEEPALRDVRLTLDEERAIGREACAEYLEKARQQGHRLVDDPRKLDYLKTLVSTMARRMKNRDRYPEIEVKLIEADTADGQCFPGGTLVFTTGLLSEPDEATVAAVVAHELAHLDLGHVYQYARRSKLAETTFRQNPAARGGSFEDFFTRGMAMVGLMMNPYRPEHEHEADCLAATWLYQEGYDPMALVRFFERLSERLRERPEEQDSPFFLMGRSHPYSRDRLVHVRHRLAQLQRWQPRDDLQVFADNLRALRARSPAPLPEAPPPPDDAAAP